jgi:hypothetical protein
MKDNQYLSRDTSPIEPERGRLLTAWLVIFLLGNGFFVYANVQFGRWLDAAWGVFGLVSGIGIWNWYKAGFYGMLIFYGYSIAASLDRQSALAVMYNLVFMGLTYFLVRDKMEMFK